MKRFFVAALTFAAVYLAASALSRLLSPAPSDFATFWIASGVYLAALLRTDMDRWPGMVTGAFVANVAFASLWIGRSIWVSLAFSTANGVEAVLGAALVLRCCRRRAIERFDLSWGGGLLRLVAAVCLFSTIVSAVIGAAVSVMAYGGDFSPAAVTWWVSDAIGVLVISPILLVSPAQWADARAGLAGRGLVEAGALTAGLVALAWFIFWRASPAMEWTYLILPVLLWITLRFRLPGVAIGMVLLSVIAVLGTIRGHGVYSEYLAADAATSLQALLAVVSICFLSLAAAVTQAHDASRRLDALNHSLAAEVARQTASLTTAATRLRLALHGAEMGTWQWTVGTTEAVLDDRQRDLLDLDPDASPSADAIYARLHPDDVARIRREFEAWVAAGGLWAYEHRLIDRRGATRWIGGRAALVHDPDGRRVATGVTFDITRQKHDEDARLEAERQLRRFADSAPATLWASDPAGAATFRSRDWYHLTGRPPREAGRDWTEAVHPADRDAVVRALGAAHERREPFRAEYRVRLASGAYGWVLDAARPFFGGDGTFLGLVGSVVDISALKRAADDQRRAEAALRESDVRFRQLADHLDAGLWILEAETARLGYVSSGFRRVWDVAPEALRSRDDWNALIHPEDRRRVAEAFAAFLADRADFLVEYRIDLPSDAVRWVQDRAFVVARDDHGAIRVVAGLTIDTTVRREAEQALRDADSQKDAFLAMLGHELRNPLAPLRTATEVLRMPSADDDAREGARAVIARQVTHVSRLVDDLLDVSRLSRGRLVIRTDAVDLRRVVTETIEDYGRVLAEARLRLHVSLPEAPVWVHGDATRLAQILGNLLHNARKFTPSGGDVSVSLDLAADGSSVRLQVRDSGLGIEPALLPHIFEVFRQGGQTLDRSEGGLGLGLSLAKGLVELHGGTVAVASAGAGRGATFDVRLPAAGGVSPSAADRVVPRARGALRIVVIEDNADAAEMLRVLLEFQGHSVALAHGGREGIAAIDVERPDLVLCDIGLPGELSGLDVAQAVRQAGGSAPYLVALTGYAGEEHVRKARAAGFDRHLAKPIGPGELDALVAHVWASRYGTIGSPASSGVAEPDGTRTPLGRD